MGTRQWQQKVEEAVNGYLLDTHAWLWVQRGEIGSLSADLLYRLNDLQRQGKVYLSAISVLEIARMVASGHYDLGISVDRFVAEAIVASSWVEIDAIANFCSRGYAVFL